MLAKRYAELQSASAQKPVSNQQKRVNVNVLKDFYLKRMEISNNQAAAKQVGVDFCAQINVVDTHSVINRVVGKMKNTICIY